MSASDAARSGGTCGRILCLLLMIAVCRAADEKDALDHFYNLEYDEAIAGLRAAVRANPEDPRRYNGLAQALFYREMYLSGSLESELATGDTPLLGRPRLEPGPGILHEIESAIGKAMALAKQRLAEKPGDTTALFELGVAHAARANVEFFVRKAWFKGLRATARSRQLHNKVVELDPEFVDARLTQGAHDYLISQLPFAYKMVGSVIGFRGDRRRGIRTVELVAREGQRRRVTAQLLLSVVYRRERQPELAVPLLLNLIEQYPRNHLYRVELAQMYADAGDMTASVRTLDEVEKRIRTRAAGFSRLTVDRVGFLRGHIQFRHRLLSEAARTLRSVVARGEQVEPETRALAGLRLGQTYDLLERRPEARTAYQGAIVAQPVSEAARLSRRYLLSPYRDQKGKEAAADYAAAADGVSQN